MHTINYFKFIQKITDVELVILNRKNNALIKKRGISYNIQNFTL